MHQSAVSLQHASAKKGVPEKQQVRPLQPPKIGRGVHLQHLLDLLIQLAKDLRTKQFMCHKSRHGGLLSSPKRPGNGADYPKNISDAILSSNSSMATIMIGRTILAPFFSASPEPTQLPRMAKMVHLMPMPTRTLPFIP